MNRKVQTLERDTDTQTHRQADGIAKKKKNFFIFLWGGGGLDLEFLYFSLFPYILIYTTSM
jgi:hypothetical protein